MFWTKVKKIEKQDTGRPALVFDFGSQSVKLLLCRYFDHRVEVLEGRKIVYPSETLKEDGTLNIDFLAPALGTEIKNLFAQRKEDQTSLAVIGVGGLGVEGYTSQINYRRAILDKTIEQKEFTGILHRVEERADQIMRKMVAWETGEAQDKAAVLASEILELSVDGYQVASPVGSKAERLSFLVYSCYCRPVTLGGIKELASRLGFRVVSIGSTMYSALRLVLEKLGSSSSAAVLDVGGANTEIGLIVAGRILGHAPLEIGGQAFSRSIAEALGKGVSEAEALKLGFAAGKLESGLMKEIREAVASDCKVFMSGVELVLKGFPGLTSLPAQFFLVGGGSLLPGVVSAMQSNEWSEKFPEVAAFKAGVLSPKDFPSFQDHTGKLNSAADVATLAAALDAADLVQEAGITNKIWQKLFRR